MLRARPVVDCILGIPDSNGCPAFNITKLSKSLPKASEIPGAGVPEIESRLVQSWRLAAHMLRSGH
jgi:hypothetical protein